MEKSRVTKAFTLTPNHIAVIHQVAKDNGQSSSSAALRHIIDKFVEYERQYGGDGKSDKVPVAS